MNDRALSTAVTHVLTMGITTILIAMLLMSTGAMLEGYSDRSADRALETVGERVAGEIERTDQLGGDDGNATVTTEHPRTVAGSAYTIEPLETDECGENTFLEQGQNCLRLSATGANAESYVPVANRTAMNTSSSATGGTIVIEHDGEAEEITLR
ncbi:hypothetical protein D8Y22_20460 [Salinadaptatus halalkaliphilus]|uniref:Type IV pilin n=1 Tax=Salinadaptatus halalkaliphilus TaxID=2419781 RepID=A0A4S3TG59_9EURY|nr:hypothetical protein [Salinadaptatus halalkaliphilus]THE62836.1 hypothetical protein D8Y22_20460 [Salinadaptatus halalkaliphilus]